MRERGIDIRYELTELISSGGMGSVWRGYDTVLDRPVAIKKIRLDQVHTGEQAEEFTQRFRMEARVTARIRHHGVPQVFDAVLDTSFETVYLVMELIDGVPLSDYIHPHTPLPQSWVTAVAAQIATVLSHAHALPVVHRDLKPDNVLVTRDGGVKVIDFGIAAILDGGRPKLTTTGQQIGTLRYMAPELVHGQRVTPRSDLYALGCVIHEMFSGTPLFDAQSEFKVQRQHLEEEPTPLRELRADVPPECEQLILDLVRKDPQQRPPDAYVVYERLLPFLPKPGAPVLATDLYLPGFPDPTRVFRRPNAPLETGQVDPTKLRSTPASAPTAPLSAMHLRTAIENAVRRYDELLAEDRYAQAADLLAPVIDSAAESQGPDSTKVLGLRERVAAAWAVGGEHRRARVEFDALADAYQRVEGRFSASAWECRAASARCRMGLGDVEGGLGELEELLADMVACGGDGSEAVLELRVEIAELFCETGDVESARRLLEPLHADLCVLRGANDELAEYVAQMLRRLSENM
ncbi:serine/threonine-protein kinase [Nocardia sp. 2YAB30]|uniref:serine/threonine-protein kinase n=1 Tax=Nocardia sp. 2YAB30 TaxID=3233022 RepID=UPI003F9D31DC